MRKSAQASQRGLLRMTTGRKRPRQLRFGAFMNVPSCHPTGWRHPDAVAECDLSFREQARIARLAEHGKLDALFFQDSVAMPQSSFVYGGKPFNIRSGRQAHIEPMTAIAGLAAVTSHIGLISTCTTSYNEPWNVARRFLTIDHISGGRVGWNLVTSQAEDEAVNFGRDKHFEHGERYDRAEGFHDAVVGLWDSAIDPRRGFAHRGEHFRFEGPLGLPPSPQGRPIVAQAGSSDVGMELSARVADMVFTAQTTIPDGKAFCAQMRERAAKHGRDPDHVRILPGLVPILGRTESEAREKHDQLRELVDDDVALRGVARLCGTLNIYDYPTDGPLPELPPSNAARARQQMIIDMGKRGMTIRQIGRVLAMSQAHRVAYGTPKELADDMQARLEADACDGFNLLFAHYPQPVEEFVTLLVPELQRRGIFRTEYEGKTLRANLGLPDPTMRSTREAARA
jgi:FMN-dependent oxidoreductase (nitrilotriacetate monooxygenase family)